VCEGVLKPLGQLWGVRGAAAKLLEQKNVSGGASIF